MKLSAFAIHTAADVVAIGGLSLLTGAPIWKIAFAVFVLNAWLLLHKAASFLATGESE